MTDIETSVMRSPESTTRTELHVILRRLGNALATLIIIAYLTSYGLILAGRGRDHLPARPLQAAWEALLSTGDYILHHPATYYWHKADLPAFGIVSSTLGASAGLLLISLAVAAVFGMLLGPAAALSRNKTLASTVLLLSVLGISTPSFLLAMLFWVVNIWVHRTFNITVLPSAGFGWDAHLLMPVLVLAMRPLAQITQLTYISFSDVLKQDYIRTADAKGLPPRLVRFRHALRNVLIPVLTTLSTSLRFSLASLPVVEMFFEWPGVGLTILQAIDRGYPELIIDLTLSLGFFFLLVNLALELFFPLIDPRLRALGGEENLQDRGTFLGWLQELVQGLREWWRSRVLRNKPESTLPPLPTSFLDLHEPDQGRAPRLRWFARHFFSNLTLIVGSLLVIGLFLVVFFGPTWTSTSPYLTHGVMTIGGTVYAPPFAPSSVFLWGSDYVGRDILALVLNGARQTLSLAFFGMLARLAIGFLLGALAGWQRGGWFDRLVTGAVGVWAAFPLTLFAMIMIQALGIQQGMWVFVVGISLVGWGEVAQYVRNQVIAIKPQPYVESARSAGARSDQILIRHLLPNLVNALLVLAVLEMGGILMLLAELGYLNIFMGGGFRAMIAETGSMQAVVAHYSDVPEWAAMIANARSWWRGYPWMVLYPGLAFFGSILAFNLLGEGLRRFLSESQVNLSRIFNRYTFTLAVVMLVLLSLLLQAAAPLGLYRAEAFQFDSRRVMEDIRALSSPEMQGRETGTPGARLAAGYIARRMAEVGLVPAGENSTYLQTLVNPRLHLQQTPTLALLDAQGQPAARYVYRQDFAEIASFLSHGDSTASLVAAAFGPQITDAGVRDPFNLANSAGRGHILLVRAADLPKVNAPGLAGLLVIADDQYTLERKDLFPYVQYYGKLGQGVPTMVITPQLAGQLLASVGSSIEDLNRLAAVQAPGQLALTAEGATLNMDIEAYEMEDYNQDTYINVLGEIPGEGQFMGMGDQVVIVSAYYDGLGVGPNGTLYPAANDNASAVAMMLELARVIKASAYKPTKNLIFVAWAGGERAEGLSVVNIMNARPGADELNVESVIELSGVGFGTGDSIALGDVSSYRLVKLFQAAAGRYSISTTTRGRSPHYGREARPGFGNRAALTLSISWDGSDALAHTPRDTISIIDPQKLTAIGRPTLLFLFVVTRGNEY